MDAFGHAAPEVKEEEIDQAFKKGTIDDLRAIGKPKEDNVSVQVKGRPAAEVGGRNPVFDEWTSGAVHVFLAKEGVPAHKIVLLTMLTTSSLDVLAEQRLKELMDEIRGYVYGIQTAPPEEVVEPPVVVHPVPKAPKPELMRIDERSYMNIRHQDRLRVAMAFDLDSIEMDNEEKTKLLALVQDYGDACNTALEFDPTIVPPSLEDVVAAVINLGPEHLSDIAENMKKPELVIVPKKMNLIDLVGVMDVHPRYQDVNGQQQKVFLNEQSLSHSLLKSDSNFSKNKIFVVDGSQYPDFSLSGGDTIAQRDQAKDFFYKRGMSVIWDLTYAVLMQKSLRAYQAAKQRGELHPEGYIVDFEERKRFATRSLVNFGGSPSDPNTVRSAYFSRSKRAFVVENYGPTYGRGLLARGSVELMHF